MAYNLSQKEQVRVFIIIDHYATLNSYLSVHINFYLIIPSVLKYIFNSMK